MIAYLANNGNGRVHYWAGRFPGRIGWLLTPETFSVTYPRPWIRYALDNGAWSCHLKGEPFNDVAWAGMVELATECKKRPEWVVVPDVVGDHTETLRMWSEYSPVPRRHGFLCAFVAQDGCVPAEVPSDADVVFLGGSTDWKWSNLAAFSRFPRLHVGRVNGPRKLANCSMYGVESFDGTGFFRGGWNSRQANQLERFLLDGHLSKEVLER